MLQEVTVQEVLARLARGEKIKTIARELGVDRHTVKWWRRLGQWQPRQGRPRPWVRTETDWPSVVRKSGGMRWCSIVNSRDLASAEACSKCVGRSASGVFKMLAQQPDRRLRQHRDPILGSLAVTHEYLMGVKIEILHPQV